jgi:hypothetical protein
VCGGVWFLALPGVPGVAGRTSGEWLQQFGFYRRIPENCSGPILISRVRRFIASRVKRKVAAVGDFNPTGFIARFQPCCGYRLYLASIIDWFTREPI